MIVERQVFRYHEPSTYEAINPGGESCKVAERLLRNNIGSRTENGLRTHDSPYLGSVDVSAKPRQSSRKGQHSLEMAGLLLITRSNPTVVLQLAEQALDHTTLPVEMGLRQRNPGAEWWHEN